MKIGVGTLRLGDKFKDDTKYGHLTKIKYCEKHGYDLIDDESVADHSRRLQWSKINLILKYLPEYDYFVWMDADTLIMNDELKLEDFITRLMGDKEIMYVQDEGWVNNGIIFAKNTACALEYFKETFNHPNEMCDEQGAMDAMWRQNWDSCKNKVQITVPQTEYNSYWWMWRWGQFLIHFPSCAEPGRPDNCLKRMIAMFCPIRMEEDTDDSFEKRRDWLTTKADTELPRLRGVCNQTARYFPLDM